MPKLRTGYGDAGIYGKGKRCAYRYMPAAKVDSLWVSQPRTANRFFLYDAECDAPAQ